MKSVPMAEFGHISARVFATAAALWLAPAIGSSVHAQTQDKAGRKPLKDIKTMKDDAAAVEKEGEAIKARYTRLFRV